MIEIIKKNSKLIIIIIVSLFLITFIYNYLFKDSDLENLAMVETTLIGEVNEDAKEIFETLKKINQIKIDPEFFREDLSKVSSNLVSFSDLVDFSVREIPRRPIGKRNIFMLEIVDNQENMPTNINIIDNQENIPTDINIIDNQENMPTDIKILDDSVRVFIKDENDNIIREIKN